MSSATPTLTAADPAPRLLDGDPATEAVTPAQRRARFFNSGNAFNLKLPAVPRALQGGVDSLGPGRHVLGRVHVRDLEYDIRVCVPSRGVSGRGVQRCDVEGA